MRRPTVIIFDVNETLLDLAGVRSVLVETLGNADRLAEWFLRLLHGSLVANETDRFRSFESISVEALNAMAHRLGLELDSSRADEMVAAFRSLPAHPDVPVALDRLRKHGFRLAVLSNGSSIGIAMQLENAGIADRFDLVVSVEAAQRFKPDPAPYRLALERLRVPPGEAVMVAAHDWDIIGARNVGIGGAFVSRPGSVWSLPDPLPTIVGDNIMAIAKQLIEMGLPPGS